MKTLFLNSTKRHQPQQLKVYTGDLLATLIFLNDSFGQKIFLMMAEEKSDELWRYFCYVEQKMEFCPTIIYGLTLKVSSAA